METLSLSVCLSLSVSLSLSLSVLTLETSVGGMMCRWVGWGSSSDTIYWFIQERERERERDKRRKESYQHTFLSSLGKCNVYRYKRCIHKCGRKYGDGSISMRWYSQEKRGKKGGVHSSSAQSVRGTTTNKIKWLMTSIHTERDPSTHPTSIHYIHTSIHPSIHPSRHLNPPQPSNPSSVDPTPPLQPIDKSSHSPLMGGEIRNPNSMQLGGRPEYVLIYRVVMYLALGYVFVYSFMHSCTRERERERERERRAINLFYWCSFPHSLTPSFLLSSLLSPFSFLPNYPKIIYITRYININKSTK